jgi:aspartate-semialdehyde dehydrogenase
VRTAHSEAVFVETQRETDFEALASAFEASEGVVFHREGIVTPRDVEGTDDVHVARLRMESVVPSPSSFDPAQDDVTSLRTGSAEGRHFALWCVGDQLRKGAATNAVQILELLLEKGYIEA